MSKQGREYHPLPTDLVNRKKKVEKLLHKVQVEGEQTRKMVRERLPDFSKPYTDTISSPETPETVLEKAIQDGTSFLNILTQGGVVDTEKFNKEIFAVYILLEALKQKKLQTPDTKTQAE